MLGWSFISLPTVPTGEAAGVKAAGSRRESRAGPATGRGSCLSRGRVPAWERRGHTEASEAGRRGPQQPRAQEGRAGQKGAAPAVSQGLVVVFSLRAGVRLSGQVGRGQGSVWRDTQ